MSQKAPKCACFFVVCSLALCATKDLIANRGRITSIPSVTGREPYIASKAIRASTVDGKKVQLRETTRRKADVPEASKWEGNGVLVGARRELVTILQTIVP